MAGAAPISHGHIRDQPHSQQLGATQAGPMHGSPRARGLARSSRAAPAPLGARMCQEDSQESQGWECGRGCGSTRARSCCGSAIPKFPGTRRAQSSCASRTSQPHSSHVQGCRSLTSGDAGHDGGHARGRGPPQPLDRPLGLVVQALLQLHLLRLQLVDVGLESVHGLLKLPGKSTRRDV